MPYGYVHPFALYSYTESSAVEYHLPVEPGNLDCGSAPMSSWFHELVDLIKPAAIPFLAIAAISLVLNCVYTQDVGESIILINFGGSLAGHTSDAGLKVKMPWQQISYTSVVVVYFSTTETDTEMYIRIPCLA